MHRIHRSAGRLLAIAAAAALTACAGDAPVAPRGDDRIMPRPALAGTWLLHEVDDAPLPARVAGGVDEGIEWALHVTADTLHITPDGRWVQRARSYQPQSNGLEFTFSMNDRGTWSVRGSEVLFESDWIENVRFTGRMTADGRLVLSQDLMMDETIGTLRLELKR